MKIVCLWCLIAAMAVIGCGGSDQEAAKEEMEDLIEQQIAILSKVTDEASAKAAAPKLEVLFARMEEFGNKLEKMEPMEQKGDEEETEAEKKEFYDLLVRYALEMGRVMEIKEAQKYLKTFLEREYKGIR